MLLSQPLSTIIALIERPMKNFLLVFCCLLTVHVAFAQTQVCPLNSNWSFGNLTHWWAYTGNNAITDANKTGNGPLAIKEVYDSNQGPPSGTIGVSSIAEYQLPSVPGIQILSMATTDPYGIFLTIPRINGYQYTNSILLGST